MGIVQAPKRRAMEEQVVPWLMQKIVGFLEEDIAINNGSELIVIDGVLNSQNEHSGTIKHKYAKIRK